ncbi:MAG: hypothetical protein ACPGJU_08725 [Coraliomargarita sp.]
MADLYFMNRKFEGICFELDAVMEYGELDHIFEDAWYWMHYRFFNCRDRILSEESQAIRTHLGNLVAMLYRSFEGLCAKQDWQESTLNRIIEELKEIIEYSKEHPICLWTYGDDSSEYHLKETVDQLPSSEQISLLLNLPHMHQHRSERLSYRFVGDEEVTAKRIKREEASLNKRRKLTRKNRQRNDQNQAGDDNSE